KVKNELSHGKDLFASSLTRPIYDVEKAFVLTPTTQGYRLTSGSELKDKEAIASPYQLQEVAISAQQAMTLGELISGSVWKGNRPTLPDSLPVIGRSLSHPSIWLAFGHQHVGFSTGPATGRLIAEMMLGESTFIDATPFLPTRFH
ncbi:MAG: NAD(P)/FAD-dependent oxidoreductase, partial [Marinomonas sp.]